MLLRGSRLCVRWLWLTRHGTRTGPLGRHPLAKYEGLDFSPEELQDAMRQNYEVLLSVVRQPAFQQLYREMMQLAPEERPAFVSREVLPKEVLARRGITLPDGVLVQVSAFGDRRPTLFALKRFLPERFHAAWENNNLTFFNEFDEDEYPHDPELAWRAPLPVALQDAVIASGGKLNEVPSEYAVALEELNTALETRPPTLPG
jgi:hypothetical protein